MAEQTGETLQTLEYLNVKNEGVEQIYLMNNDGTLISNNQVQYVSEGDAESVLAGMQPCSVLGVGQHQFILDVNGRMEIVKGQELVLQGAVTNEVYTSEEGHFLTKADVQTNVQVDYQDMPTETIMEAEGVYESDGNKEYNLESVTQVMLDEEQCRILEEKGKVLLEQDGRTFILDHSGLREIPSDADFTQKLKEELASCITETSSQEEYIILDSMENLKCESEERSQEPDTKSEQGESSGEGLIKREEDGEVEEIQFQQEYVDSDTDDAPSTKDHTEHMLTVTEDAVQVLESEGEANKQGACDVPEFRMIMAKDLPNILKKYIAMDMKKKTMGKPSSAKKRKAQSRELPNILKKYISINEPDNKTSPQIETNQTAGVEEIEGDQDVNRKRQRRKTSGRPQEDQHTEESQEDESVSEDSICVKVDCPVSAIPSRLVLGRLAGGGVLVARKPRCRQQRELYVASVAANGMIQLQKLPMPVPGTSSGMDRADVSLLSSVLARADSGGCAGEDLAQVERTVAALLLNPAVRGRVTDKNIVVTKMARQTRDGVVMSRQVAFIVTGRISNFAHGDSDEDWRFIYMPDLLNKKLDNEHVSEFEMSTEGDPLRKEAAKPHDNLLHINIMETVDQDNTKTTNVVIMKKSVSVPLEYERQMGMSTHACAACARMFTCEADLIAHQQQEHTGENAPVPSTGQVPWPATPTLHFNKRDTATSNGNGNGFMKLYMCFYCKKMFNRCSNLRRHMSIHLESAGERAGDRGVYVCNMCSCAYFYPSTLTRHIMACHIGSAQWRAQVFEPKKTI